MNFAKDYSGGDGSRWRTPGSIKKGRLYGLPVPVFSYDNDDEDCNTFMSCNDMCIRNDSSNARNHDVPQQKYHMDVLEQYYTCPICYDPCIESTTTNCGHKFCKVCIETWARKKPVCPICSTLITSKHRIFNDDLFIESQLDCLPASVKDRFETAQNSRLLTIYKSQHSKNMLKTVRRKLDNSVSYLRCKSVSQIGATVSYSAHRVFSSLPTYSSDNRLIIGILIGIVLMLLASFLLSHASFFTYMYLAIQHYNGSIPEEWIKPDNEPEPTEKGTWFSKLIYFTSDLFFI